MKLPLTYDTHVFFFFFLREERKKGKGKTYVNFHNYDINACQKHFACKSIINSCLWLIWWKSAPHMNSFCFGFSSFWLHRFVKYIYRHLQKLVNWYQQIIECCPETSNLSTEKFGWNNISTSFPHIFSAYLCVTDQF